MNLMESRMHFDRFDSLFRLPVLLSRLSLTASPTVGAPPSGAGPSAAPLAAAPPAPVVAPVVPSGAPPAPPTGSPTATPSGPLPANEPNIAALRSSHELITRLGGPEAAQRAVEQVQILTQLHTEGAELARQLGYTPESFQAAFNQDPADTIAYMRQKAQEMASDPNRQPDLNQVLDQRLGPLEQQLRQQNAERANQAVDGELSRVMSEHAIFKGKSNIPQDVQGFVQDLAREYLKYDREGLQKIFKGDMTPVSAAFTKGLDYFLKAVNAYSQWQGQPGSGPRPNVNVPPAPGQPPNGQANPDAWSLQNLIDGDEKAFNGLTSTRR